ncbi:MAG: T9SS type A sorting domain-containing protein [Bacteroidetes bacterium]|nr:T9SS type A sorting domain-containing protein [Bacteroidota bacterium]
MNVTKLMAVALVLCVNLQAQNFWEAANETSIRVQGKRQIIPQKYVTLTLNAADMKSKLFAAPHEKNVHINNSLCIISLPLPDGTFQSFRVVESPVMASELAASFPDIKTFSVKGIDDPYANGKLDWAGNTGFHGMVRTPHGDFFIDPYSLNDITHYITYYTADFVKDPADVLPEVGVIENEETNAHKKDFPSSQQHTSSAHKTAFGAVCVGAELRKYRLAVGCTGQYAIASTGMSAPTTTDVLNRVVTTVNRVDGVYETEVAVRLELVPQTTLTLYLKTNTTSSIVAAPTATAQSYTGNNNAGTLISESHAIITNLIGSANFDIGHTFSTGGGGLANLGCVCQNNAKALGITGSPNPVNDPYDIDYVAHEIGHQFGGNHTFNATTGSCGGGNRSAITAVEPGSGITIMGYAGICGGTNNLANNSIAYFHAISYDEIVNYTNNSTGNNCATFINTGNQPPVVTGAGDYVVPASTPFYLTGSATDPDGDALTYSWEEVDVATASGNWNSASKPFFRSYAPTTSPTRYFPIQNAATLGGTFTTTKGEYLPNSSQNLQFRFTARDNKMGGGGVCYDVSNITIDGGSIFAITYPNAAGITWTSQTQEAIIWNNNGTDIDPINCATVRIYISYNSGSTYSVLVNETENDGFEIVTVPTVSASIATCRIRIESVGNVFYDWSDKNFKINVPADTTGNPGGDPDDTTGIRKISVTNPMGLSVYPNPSDGKFTVSAADLNASHQTKLVVQNVLGQTVFESSYIGKTELKETIDLSALSQGVYFIKVSNNGRQSAYRVIKD